MTQFLWWQTGVIYQIYPRSFMDASGDGIGDLQGVRSRLDYLQWLGVDVIWFSPVFPSPMADFGYDVADYTDINPDYGTLDDFDQLLAEAHQRGIRVLLDLVPNHTSDQHQWFLEARSSRDNPYRDWYIWRDPKPEGSPPNNWMAYFGGPAWTFDEATGQYYLHNFTPEQPELNWRNPAVEQAIFEAIRFWLRRGLDGFRVDVIDRILKDEQLRDNPPNPDWREGDSPHWRWLRVHSEGHPDLPEYMRRLRAVFDEFPDKVIVGEISYDLTLPQMMAFYGDERDGHGDAVHLPFNFGLTTRAWDADIMRDYINAYEGLLPAYAWPNFVLGNHDLPRLASRVGAQQARVAALMLLSLRGTPTLYYGDELGMPNSPVPEALMQDPQGRNKAGFNRDECRAPMPWDDSPNTGFSPPGVETWLPPVPDAAINVAAQRDDPGSMLALYRRLLAYRRQTPALHQGNYQHVAGVPAGCFAYMRQSGEQRRLIVLNFQSVAQTIHLDEFDSGRVACSTHHERDGLPVDLSGFELLPDEGVIIEL
jgi:alpha-glucosidase